MVIFRKDHGTQRCDLFTSVFEMEISRGSLKRDDVVSNVGFSQVMKISLLQGCYSPEEHQRVSINHIPLDPVLTQYLVMQTAHRWTLTVVF